jgi:hypothetical protein
MTLDVQAILDTTVAEIHLPRGHFSRDGADAMLKMLTMIASRIDARNLPEPIVDEMSAKWRIPLRRSKRKAREDLLVTLEDDSEEIKLSMKIPGMSRMVAVTRLKPAGVEDRDALEWMVRSCAHVLGMALDSYDRSFPLDQQAIVDVADAAMAISAIADAETRIGAPALGGTLWYWVDDAKTKRDRDAGIQLRIREIVDGLKPSTSLTITGTAETEITISLGRVLAGRDAATDPVAAMRAIARTTDHAWAERSRSTSATHSGLEDRT